MQKQLKTFSISQEKYNPLCCDPSYLYQHGFKCPDPKVGIQFYRFYTKTSVCTQVF